MLANNNPVSSSTAGYCHEMTLPQPRHLLRCAKKLISGISSYQWRDFPQEKQNDLPPTKEIPVCKREITTLRKLPKKRPKIKINTPKTSSIQKSIPCLSYGKVSPCRRVLAVGWARLYCCIFKLKPIPHKILKIKTGCKIFW